jgi:hypothetical protein
VQATVDHHIAIRVGIIFRKLLAAGRPAKHRRSIRRSPRSRISIGSGGLGPHVSGHLDLHRRVGRQSGLVVPRSHSLSTKFRRNIRPDGYATLLIGHAAHRLPRCGRDRLTRLTIPLRRGTKHLLGPIQEGVNRWFLHDATFVERTIVRNVSATDSRLRRIGQDLSNERQANEKSECACHNKLPSIDGRVQMQTRLPSTGQR